MRFESLEDEVRYLRAMVRMTRLADDILEDCLGRQLGLSTALDVFIGHAMRMTHARAGFVVVRGSQGPVLSRIAGRLPVPLEVAVAREGAVPLAHHTLFVKPLNLGAIRLGELGLVLEGHFEDGGERLWTFVDALGEQLDTALLGFLAVSELHSPLARLDELGERQHFDPRARLGQYELVSPLGTGGMAQVMVARTLGPEGLGRLVALKRILPHLTSEPGMVQQFLDEARIGLRLSHPNLVTIYDFGEAAGGYYIAMELVRGVDLEALLATDAGPLEGRLASAVLTQALMGLHAAHELRDDDGALMNLVHRDLSPNNLMVGFEGRVKLVDFGVAKARKQRAITLPGLVKGKPLYMSPEQATGERLDRRSDLFAMGLILYEALTGVRPFSRVQDVQSMMAVVNEPLPAHPALHREVWELLQKALAKSPADRFDDAESFAQALREVLPPAPETELGRMAAIHFPERLRQVTAWERPQPPRDVAEQTTQLRPAVRRER